jgi:hypothetical protein
MVGGIGDSFKTQALCVGSESVFKSINQIWVDKKLFFEATVSA